MNRICNDQSGAEKCHLLLSQLGTVQMGILNITPDSFSDGGLYLSSISASQKALQLVSQGAQIIDVGGVSTRPGSTPVNSCDEWQRVGVILKELRKQLPAHVLVSLDTSSPLVACRAAQEGLIDLINDVAAFRKKADLEQNANHDQSPFVNSDWTTAHVASHFELGLVVMHMQGEPQTMQRSPVYNDCVHEVSDFLDSRLQEALRLGVRWCAIDPGIGFGKTLDHNLSLLTPDAFSKFRSLNAPLLIGLSRKSFLKQLAERSGELPDFGTPNEELIWRDQQSELWEKKCESWGASIIRTHSIKRN
jgi:dihydropteroate synthase